MPTKAYGKFLKNLETFNRLDQTYGEVRISRNKKGKLPMII